MSTVDLQASYTAADTTPPKLLLNDGVRKLLPVHVQWFPTNRCNLHCTHCSCSNRDNQLEMPIDQACSVIESLASYGCKAVTITGGGEPTCHPQLSKMVQAFQQHGIKIGLVTNGLLLNTLDLWTLQSLTWCRISNNDERSMTSRYQQILAEVVSSAEEVDWAFSHVVSQEPNYEEIKRIVQFANDHRFTHVRLVADILNAGEIDLQPVREYLVGIDQHVLYQPRNFPVPSRSCAIGYIKPVIAPDFKMYLCCGVQYALEEPSRDLPEALSMGDARDLDAVYGQTRKPFTVHCAHCYYEGYNNVLRPLANKIEHKEFL